MGAVEEGGKVAGGFIEAMKTQPLALALCVMNVALLALIYYIAHECAANRTRDISTMFENQKIVQELLSRCKVSFVPLIWPDQR